MKKQTWKIIFICALSLMVFAALYGCNKSKQKQESRTSAVEKTQTQEKPAEQGEVEEESAAETMAHTFYTADTLYTCPMHPEMVTDDPDAQCSICKMKVAKMSAEKMAQLRASHPKGCLKCSIIVPGDSKMEKCPSCGMPLQEIANPEHAESHEH